MWSCRWWTWRSVAEHVDVEWSFSAAAMTATGSDLDVSSILSSVGGGGVGGAVVMVIVGLIKAKMAKSN